MQLPIIQPLVAVEQTARIWSFSKYKIYKECHERYVREYLIRLRVPPISQKPFLQGSIVHGLIEAGREAYVSGLTTDLRAWCLDHLDEHFTRHAAKVTDWTPGEPDRARLEAEQLTNNYVTLVLDNDLLTGQVYCEHVVGTHQAPLWLDNGVGLTGFIDWAKLVTPSSGVILDAKTSRSMKYLDQDQLLFYALGIEEQFKVTVERVGWMMVRWGETVWYDITREDKDRLKADLLRASQEVVQMELGTTPTYKLCDPCPHNDACGTYAHWITSGGFVSMDDEF